MRAGFGDQERAVDLLAALGDPVIAVGGADREKMPEIGEDQIGRPGQQHCHQAGDDDGDAPVPPASLPQA